MAMVYNNPPTTPGSHEQLIPFYWQKKALIDARKAMFFGQLADTTSMPKHFGKTIKRYHYLPFLDDRNINDQGIDATGSAVLNEVTITVTDPSGATRFAVGKGSDAAAALTAAQAQAVSMFKNLGITVTTYAAAKTTLTTAGWKIVEGAAQNSGGNLYGSSKDVGTISGQLPVLSEQGGRVNRVGFTRVSLEGNIENFGFFDEYTEDSVQFDNDSDLLSHISRETIRAANEITEDMIQIDLLEGANVVYYGGSATSASELTGENGATASVLDYETLVRVETTLNDNLCPKDTKVISGSRMIDTRTVGASRYTYVGSELKLNLLKMKNFHNEKAFIHVHEYAEAGNVAAGEIGSINNFRFIEVPKMLHWDGAGATVTNNAGYIEHNGKYSVFPLLVVGSESFTTIGFQTDGENTKFVIRHKKPSDTVDRSDPYGKIGFYSIQWWYGTMILRPEWIACVKVVAEK